MTDFLFAKVRQGPTEQILRTFDYGGAMVGGDTLLTSSWAIAAAPGNTTPDTLMTVTKNSFDNFRANVEITGGVLGNAYYITNTVMTSPSSETLVRTLQCSVVQR